MTALALILIFLATVCIKQCFPSQYVAEMKAKFRSKFMKTCAKYSFVHKYMESMKNPSDKYLIYVFHDGKGKLTGGLGDRLAGIVTAVAYAIRTNRNFLMQGDESFEKTFQPYHLDDEIELSWGNWEFAKWDRSYSSNMTQLRCHNPKSSHVYCALDHTASLENYKVVRYIGNRAYICRWLIKEDLDLRSELEKSLGINIHSNLYEVAGCLLRLAMHPTNLLWEESVKQLAQMNDRYKEWSASKIVQVGIHFRCGDSSFVTSKTTASSSSLALSPCMHHPNIPWKGIVFVDELSTDSPLAMAQCAKRLLEASDGIYHRNNSATNTNAEMRSVAFVASDNTMSATQITNTIDWPNVYHPPPACHIDLQKSLQCSLSTITQWFLLAQSDYLITQAMSKATEETPFFDTKEYAYLRQPVEYFPPISAFSRFAGIYGLIGENVLNDQCVATSASALSHYSHGNWVCNPKTFY